MQAQGWAWLWPRAGAGQRQALGPGQGTDPPCCPGAFVPPMRSPLPGTSTRQSRGQTFLPAHGAQVRAALLRAALRRAACVPESSRVPGGSAPPASPTAEDALLPAQSGHVVVWKRERRLRWAAWEQTRCRARGTCSPVEGEGTGGLEPAEAAAAGLGRERGRLAVSLPHWSRRGHCNSSQGAGCSAQPPSIGCGPAQPCAFPARCLCPHTSGATLGIAAAPPTGTAAGTARTGWPTPALCRAAWCRRVFRAVSLWEDPAQAPGRTEEESL